MIIKTIRDEKTLPRVKKALREVVQTIINDHGKIIDFTKKQGGKRVGYTALEIACSAKEYDIAESIVNKSTIVQKDILRSSLRSAEQGPQAAPSYISDKQRHEIEVKIKEKENKILVKDLIIKIGTKTSITPISITFNKENGLIIEYKALLGKDQMAIQGHVNIGKFLDSYKVDKVAFYQAHDLNYEEELAKEAAKTIATQPGK